MDPNNMAPVGVDEIPEGFTADPNSAGGGKNAERQAQVDSLLDQILDPAGEGGGWQGGLSGGVGGCCFH